MSAKHRRGINLSAEQEEHINDLPEKKLLRAILDRWFKDILQLRKNNDTNTLQQIKKYKPLTYLSYKGSKEWSLNWILIHLFDDPIAVRRKIEAVVKKIIAGSDISEILGMEDLDYAGYNYSETSISIRDCNSGDTLLHPKKANKTTIH